MQLQHVHLHSSNLAETLSFYQQLGCPVVQKHPRFFTLQIGQSRLSFRQSDHPSWYHFAFNIPAASLPQAIEWAEQQELALLTHEGHARIPFPNWDAEAVYFLDPSGNIVEMIARADIPALRPEPFSPDTHWLHISEIGLPVSEVQQTYRLLYETTELGLYWGDLKSFCSMGDARGLFIIVDAAQKTWFPTDIPATPFRLTVEFEQNEQLYRLSHNTGKLIVQPN